MSKYMLRTAALLMASCIGVTLSAQQSCWTSVTDSAAVSRIRIAAGQLLDKTALIYTLDIEPLRQQLFSVAGAQARQHTTVITLPNTKGVMERFEVTEASNFNAALQARYPGIRSFSGRCLDDPGSLLRISLSPQGLQTVIFRAGGGKEEIIEPCTTGRNQYVVYNASDAARNQSWECGTAGAGEEPLISGLNTQVSSLQRTVRSRGKLRTLRIALTCSGEYANKLNAYNGTPGDVSIVIAAFNTVLSYCNAILERDLALHLNLVNATEDAIYFDPANDPFTSADYSVLMDQAQQELDSKIGTANYDMGILFSIAPTGHGQVHTIGSICMDNIKGKSLVQGQNSLAADGSEFQRKAIHEIGHLLGGGHTFTHINQQPSPQQSVEVASGITVMSYGGLGGTYNLINRRIPFFHERTIRQIESFLEVKQCVVNEDILANNSAPEISPIQDHTIPISTPYIIMCHATDANNNNLSFSLEQDDNAGPSEYGSKSIAYPQKITGPVFTTSGPFNSTDGRKQFIIPNLNYILNGEIITGPYPGGNNGVAANSLSSVGRIINHIVTVRDNVPYSQNSPRAIGQTAITGTKITVDGSSGPFAITSQNDPVSYPAGSAQTINWSVNGTDRAPVNCLQVIISFSPDQGITYPPAMSITVPNNGSAQFTFPQVLTSRGRISIVAAGNVFFDINNADIGLLPPQSFNFGNTTAATVSCNTNTSVQASLPVLSNGGFSGPVQLSATEGVPSGCTIEFPVNPVTPGSTAAIILTNAHTLSAGTYRVIIEGKTTDPVITVRKAIYFIVSETAAPAITEQPSSAMVCPGNRVAFHVVADGTDLQYKWQMKAPDESGFTDMNMLLYPVSGVNTNTLNLAESEIHAGLNGYQYRCRVSATCGISYSQPATLNIPAGIIKHPETKYICEGSNVTLSVLARVGQLPPAYQWEVKRPGSPEFTPVNSVINPTAATATLELTNITEGLYHLNKYRCVINYPNSCRDVSAEAILYVFPITVINIQPVSTTTCEGNNVSFFIAASGTDISYQWEVKTSSANWTTILNANAGTISLSAVTPGMNNNKYRCKISKAGCGLVYTAEATLTVNELPFITVNPQNQTACTGGSVSFTIITNGNNLHFQWQKKLPGSSVWIDFAESYTGANSQLNVSSIPFAENGCKFRCAVSKTGCNTVYSAEALLTVTQIATISVQPASQTICNGGSASFTVIASGAGISYQWEVKTATASWAAIPNATAGILNLPTVAQAMNNNKYRCKISKAGCISIYSAEATLTIPAAATITSQPQSINSCELRTVRFSVTATGSNPGFQWQVKLSASEGWLPVQNGATYTGTNTNTLSLAAIPASWNGRKYRCAVTNQGCSPVYTNEVTLTVNTRPVIINQPQSVTVCEGGRADFFVTASGTNLTYQWWESIAGRPAVQLSGQTSSTYSIPNVPLSWDGRKYYVTVSSTGCIRAISQYATLRAETMPAIIAQPQSVSVCPGATVNFSVTASGTNLTWQWWKNTPGNGWEKIIGATANTLSLTNVPVNLGGTKYACKVKNGCAEIESNEATLTIPDHITRDPGSRTACPGQTVMFTVGTTTQQTGAGTSYQWQVKTPSSTGFSVINAVANSTASTPSLVLPNLTYAMNGNQYQCRVSNMGSCEALSAAATLTITGSSSTISSSGIRGPESKIVCTGNPVSFSVSNLPTAFVGYAWQVKTPSGNGFINMAGNNTATLSFPAVTASMNGNQYRCIITYACGDIITAAATLTVPGIERQPQAQTVCQYSEARFSVVATPGYVTGYRWKVKTPGSADYQFITGNNTVSNAELIIPGYGLTSSMNGNLYRCEVIYYTPCGGAAYYSEPALLTVKDKIIRDPASQTVCNGGVAEFYLNVAGNVQSYKWQLKPYGSIWGFADIAGATSGDYRISLVTPGMSGNQYRCKYVNECGNTVTSSPGTLYVPPGIVTQPASQTVCAGSPVTFSVGLVTGMPGVNYQWKVKTSATGDFVAVSNATAASYTISSVSASMNGYKYVCVVSNNLCVSTLSGEAVLTVPQTGVIKSNPVSTTVCSHGTAEFSVEYCNYPNPAPAYQWMIVKPDGVELPVTGNSTATTPHLVLTNVTMDMQGNIYRCRITDLGIVRMSSAATLTVTGIISPVVNYQLPACIENEVRIDVQAAGAVSGYQWQTKRDNNSLFINITNNTSATTSSLRIPNFSFNDNMMYRCRVSRYGCMEDVSAIVVVLPYRCGLRSGQISNSPEEKPNPADSVISLRTIKNMQSGKTDTMRNRPGEISLYPVPNSGTFNIRLNTDNYPAIDLKIYDQSGRLLLSRQAKGLAAGSVIPVTLPHAVNGLYQLRITNTNHPNKEVIVKTFMILDGAASIK